MVIIDLQHRFLPFECRRIEIIRVFSNDLQNNKRSSTRLKEKGRINYSDSVMLEHLIQQEKDREIYHKDEGIL